LAQLRLREKRLAELDVQVKVLTFDGVPLAQDYLQRTQLTWPLLLDEERVLYKAYGMPRGTLWNVFGLPAVIKYLRLILRGRMPGKAGSDWRQLGGDVLIDPAGVVQLHFVSAGPHDRPTVNDIIQAIVHSGGAREP